MLQLHIVEVVRRLLPGDLEIQVSAMDLTSSLLSVAFFLLLFFVCFVRFICRKIQDKANQIEELFLSAVFEVVSFWIIHKHVFVALKSFLTMASYSSMASRLYCILMVKIRSTVLMLYLLFFIAEESPLTSHLSFPLLFPNFSFSSPISQGIHSRVFSAARRFCLNNCWKSVLYIGDIPN